MISLKTHNIADYCLGAAFLLIPFVAAFEGMLYAHDVFTVLGLAIIGYSLLSDHRYSAIRAIPLNMHMTFDVVVGIFAILAPWVYGYREELSAGQAFAHWLMGLSTIAVAAFTGRHAEPPGVVLSPEAELFEERERRAKQAA